MCSEPNDMDRQAEAVIQENNPGELSFIQYVIAGELDLPSLYMGDLPLRLSDGHIESSSRCRRTACTSW